MVPRQIYDYIDRHITKLDKDCKAFDAGAVQCGGRAGCTASKLTVRWLQEATDVITHVSHCTTRLPVWST